MEASGGMVPGSHKRNELVRIRHDSDSGPKPLKDMNGQICQTCGDTVGVSANGDFFVACNECAFPNPNYQQFPHPNSPVRHNPSPQVVEVCEGPTDSLGRRKWMPKEEMVLVGAFLTASVDPILGNDQKAESFWRRTVAYFNENSGSAQPRNLKQCKNKFHATMAKVTQFAGFYNTRASDWQSGASDEQIIADARADYRNANNKKEFPFEHIWKMVRKEPKWKQQHRFEALYQPGFADSYQSKKKTRVNEAGDYTSSDAPETPASQAESNTEFPTQPLDSEEPSHDPPPSVERRPMGQKAAKRNGKGKVGESSQSSGRIESVAEYYERLQLSINVHAEAIREKNAVNREKTKVAQQKARDKAYFKLIELEQKDTSNMTPAALEKHMVHIAYIREQHGFK